MSSALSFSQLIRRSRFLLFVTVSAAAFGLLFSLLVPLQYSSTIRLLVTQPNAGATDPYTASKFTERIAGSLSELLYSSSFANSIISKTTATDTQAFPVDEYTRRKVWHKTIETTLTPGTGILSITAYRTTREQATLLVSAASQELILQAPNYWSGVRLQIIDTPLPSRWIARPEFVKNALFGAMIGFLLGLLWTIGRAPERRN